LFFWGHWVHLEKPIDALFSALAGPVRRGIRKAENSKLRIEFSAAPEALRTFYKLHCGTRQRHGVPPQPMRFFDNIAKFVFGLGHGEVGVARLSDQPVAAAVFFNNSREAIYKFGASNYSFQGLRPNNLLMWEAIKRYAEQGCTYLHLGRTSLANEGLRRFKLGFGASEERLTYYRYDLGKRGFVTDVDRSEGWRNEVIRFLPGPLLRLVGAMVYPHLS
jgi:lipid II:glycine glycyltransferase (peptidoglycan interpeptide bridge formation enzyme)